MAHPPWWDMEAWSESLYSCMVYSIMPSELLYWNRKVVTLTAIQPLGLYWRLQSYSAFSAKHKASSIHSAVKIFTALGQFHTKILHIYYSEQHEQTKLHFEKSDPVIQGLKQSIRWPFCVHGDVNFVNSTWEAYLHPHTYRPNLSSAPCSSSRCKPMLSICSVRKCRRHSDIKYACIFFLAPIIIPFRGKCWQPKWAAINSPWLSYDCMYQLTY